MAAHLAIVVPAYNEAEGIGPTIERLSAVIEALPYPTELIIVDDGSTDDTAAVAERSGVNVVRQGRNRGYGAALKAGIARTSAEWVVIIDADGTYPADAIPTLMKLAEHADMVVGARAAHDRSIPVERRPAKWMLRKLAEYLTGQPIPDLNSGLRVMRRSVVKQFIHILPSGFSFTTTITLSMMSTGYDIVYEPIHCKERVGSSKIRPQDFANFVMLVLRTIVLFNPLKVFLPVGALMFVVGIVKFVYDVFLWNLSETAVMAFLSALVVWSVGLLADMISRLQLRPPGQP